MQNSSDSFFMTEGSPSVLKVESAEITDFFKNLKTTLANFEQPNLEDQKKKVHIEKILRPIQKKINSIKQKEPKQFIAMLIAFLYVNRIAKKFFPSLKLSNNFYKNLNKTLQQTYSEYILHLKTEEEIRYSYFLSIMLFSCGNLCEIASQGQIPIRKLLSSSFMNIFLKIEFPHSIKSIKYYQTVMGEIVKRQKHLKKIELIPKSSLTHLLIFSENKELRKFCLNTLNSSFLRSKEEQILNGISVENLLQKLRNLLLSNLANDSLSQILLFASKLLFKKDKALISSFLLSEEIVKIIIQHKLKKQNKRGIVKYLRIIRKDCLMQVLLKITNPIKTSLTFDILNEIIPFLQQDDVLALIQQNLLQKMKESVDFEEKQDIQLCLEIYKKIQNCIRDVPWPLFRLIKEKIEEYWDQIAEEDSEEEIQISMLSEFEKSSQFLF